MKEAASSLYFEAISDVPDPGDGRGVANRAPYFVVTGEGADQGEDALLHHDGDAIGVDPGVDEEGFFDIGPDPVIGPCPSPEAAMVRAMPGRRPLRGPGLAATAFLPRPGHRRVVSELVRSRGAVPDVFAGQHSGVRGRRLPGPGACEVPGPIHAERSKCGVTSGPAPPSVAATARWKICSPHPGPMSSASM